MIELSAPDASLSSGTSINAMVADFEDISLQDNRPSSVNLYSDVSSTRSSSFRDSSSSVSSAAPSDVDAALNNHTKFSTKLSSSSATNLSNPSGSPTDISTDSGSDEELNQQTSPDPSTRPRLNTYALRSLKSRPSLSLLNTCMSSPTTSIGSSSSPRQSISPLIPPSKQSHDVRHQYPVSSPCLVNTKPARHAFNGSPRMNSGLGIYSSSAGPVYNLPARRVSADNLSSPRAVPQSVRMSAPQLATNNRRQIMGAPSLRKALSINQLPRMDAQLNVDFHMKGKAPRSQPPPNRLKRNRTLPKRLSTNELEMRYDIEDTDDYVLPDDTWMINVPMSPALMDKKNALGPMLSSSKRNNVPAKRKSHSSIKQFELPAINESDTPEFFQGMERLADDATLADKLSRLPDLQAPPKITDSNSSSPSRSPSMDSLVSRPDGLPPKTPAEEQKHMQEFQELIEITAANEQKKASEENSRKERIAKQQAKDFSEWKSKFIDLADPMDYLQHNYSKMREMWWRGIPAKCRESVWQIAIGNRLHITPETYKNCLAEADRSKWLPVIAKTVESHTLPDLRIFGRKCGPLHEDLVNVLLALTAYRGRSIGFRRGIDTLAGILLLNLNPFNTFTALVNLLNDSTSSGLLMALFAGDLPAMDSYTSNFLKVLNSKCPQLTRHFQDVKLSPSAFIEPMLVDVFSRNLPLECLLRIMDILVFEGDAILLRVALGIVIYLEPHLYGSRDEILETLGWNSKQLNIGDENTFMHRVRLALKPVPAS